uniref:type VI secretion system tip protein VgrG n=1 Tax=Ningiella ruwaisensis TaxID=2364274 RepID=UPI0010A00D12|nr:type VI secretion system tip protein VgrG [Ningiella ruwaisensis]
MPVIPLRSADLSSFRILSEGSEVSLASQIEFIDVRHESNRISTAEFSLIDGDAASQNFALASSEELQIGRKISIELGYQTNTDLVFEGIVVSISVKALQGGSSRTTVLCKHPAFQMTQVIQHRYFQDISLDDLLNQLFAPYDIALSIEISSGIGTQLFEQIIQMHQSDWDFMLALLYQYGLFIAYRDQVLVISDLESAASPTNPAASLNPLEANGISFGRDIIDCDVQISAQHQFENVDVAAWDASSQNLVNSESSAQSINILGTSQGDLAQAAGEASQRYVRESQSDGALLSEVAKGISTRHAMQAYQGTLTIQGRQGLIIGEQISLQGLGKTFEGKAFVSGIMHRLVGGNWTSIVQIGLPKFPIGISGIFHNGMSGALIDKAGATGLHIAKVVALQDDPNANERIKVHLVHMHLNQDGIWARLLQQDAGAARGAVFRPSIGDEVIVSFIHSHIPEPVVLGALHSSANASPIEASDDNFKRGWTTASGIELIFDDDSQSVLIKTPEGKRVELNDDNAEVIIEDETGNMYVMDSSGISLSSDGDISISASKDVNINGLNINLESQTNASFKAGANMTVEGSAITAVKGSLVQIN